MSEFPGIWPGIVTDVNDPKKECRIKVRVHQVYGSLDKGIPDSAIPWALPCLPFTGKSSGLAVTPEVGSGAWVMFIGNDPRFPVWLGCWFSDSDILSEHKSGYLPGPKSYCLKTPGNLLLEMNDSSAKGVLLRDSEGQSYQMMSTSKSIVEKAVDTKTTMAKNIVFQAATLSAIIVSAIAMSAASMSLVIAGAAILTAASVILGNVVTAQKLCNKAMMDLYNSHTHMYNPGPGSPVATLPPVQSATEDVHTTKDTKAS